MEHVIVKNIEEIAPYDGPGAIPGIRFRGARDALGVSAWGMNVLELDAGCTGYPSHDHQGDGQEEVYVILRGSVELHAQGETRLLKQGDMVRVGPTVERKLVTKNEPVTVLAIGGKPGAPYKPGIAG